MGPRRAFHAMAMSVPKLVGVSKITQLPSPSFHAVFSYVS